MHGVILASRYRQHVVIDIDEEYRFVALPIIREVSIGLGESQSRADFENEHLARLQIAIYGHRCWAWATASYMADQNFLMGSLARWLSYGPTRDLAAVWADGTPLILNFDVGGPR